MSNALAIAAATATLRSVLLTKIVELDATLSDLDVTTQPPDLARKSGTKPQLNIFLYHTALNAGWRNMDLPNQVKPGERGVPPLALNLYYMITAYAREDNDTLDLSSHRIFCAAMSVLHDYPILKKSDIGTALPSNDLAEQIERIRITPQPLSVDDISKLWTIYQTPYRISAAYELTVALVDSNLAPKSGLPVLRRGSADQGVFAVASKAPQLTALRAANKQAAARLGEDLIIVGDNLRAAGNTVRFEGMRFDATLELAPRAGDTPDQLIVRLPTNGPAPDDPAAFAHWAPGFYALSVVSKLPDTPAFSSNQIGFALAPSITVSPLNVTPGDFVLTVNCTPQLRPGQQVRLVFGEQHIAPLTIGVPADATQPTSVTFQLTSVPADTYLVRLRVDGVDSIPVIYAGNPALPAFDPNQQVTVAP